MATSPGGVVTIDISDSENNAVIQPVVRKRLSLESFEGHMSKRIKLSDNCHNETVTSDSSGRRLQVPAASNNGRLRLGVCVCSDMCVMYCVYRFVMYCVYSIYQ